MIAELFCKRCTLMYCIGTSNARQLNSLAGTCTICGTSTKIVLLVTPATSMHCVLSGVIAFIKQVPFQSPSCPNSEVNCLEQSAVGCHAVAFRQPHIQHVHMSVCVNVCCMIHVYYLLQAQLKREGKQGASTQDDLHSQICSLQSRMDSAEQVALLTNLVCAFYRSSMTVYCERSHLTPSDRKCGDCLVWYNWVLQSYPRARKPKVEYRMESSRQVRHSHLVCHAHSIRTLCCRV